MKKRLYLIFHNRFPGEKAASLFAAKSAEAFAREGIEVTLLVPRRFFRRGPDPYYYYAVENNFRVLYLPVVDFLWLPTFQTLFFWLSFATFSVSVLMYLLAVSREEDILFSNESLPLWLLSFFRPNTFYEMHDFPESKLEWFRNFIGRMRWVLAHNTWKAERVEKELGVPKEKILCVPNAVDVKKFHLMITPREARKKIGLPLDKKIILYTGHLYEWKGVDTLFDAAFQLPEEYLVVFVGGTPKDMTRVKARNSESDGRALFVGTRSHREMPLWQAAADVLVLPNTAKEKISAYYTSPMKLFEYMASERPIVASRLPSIEEIVSDREVLFFEPDNAKALAGAIVHSLADRVGSESRARAALKKVQGFDWSLRTKKIVEFMGL